MNEQHNSQPGLLQAEIPVETFQVERTTYAAAQDAPPPQLSAKIIRNVIFGGLRYALVAPIPFLITPLILHKIGVGGYGTWAVFLAINGLTSLADMGLVGTLSKFVAEYYARQDFFALGKLLNSGLVLFLALAGIIIAVLWFAAPELARHLFHGSTLVSGELITLFRCFLIVVAANILNLLFSSVTSGLQRLDVTNMLGAANVVMGALFGGVLLLLGWGLRGLVYGYIVAGILTLTANVVVVRKLLPQVKISPMRFETAEARRMFSFSLQLYVTQAAVAVHNQVEKIFLAMLVGVAPVGWYDIASDVALKIRSAVGFILSPVLPAASELSALGDEDRLRELYYRTHKYLALFGVPAVGYAAVMSRRFVELWLGPGLTMIAIPLSILVLVNFFNLATGPGFCIFAGRGELRPGIHSALLGIVLNVVLSLALIYEFGFAGAVLGTSISLIVSSAYFIAIFHRRTGYSLTRLLREGYLKSALASLISLAALFVFRPARELSWLGLVLMTFGFGLLYFVIILLSRFFDEYDWTKIEHFVPLAQHLRRAG